jgi:hypothetical protein
MDETLMNDINLGIEIEACLRQGDFARAYDLIELRDALLEAVPEASDA